MDARELFLLSPYRLPGQHSLALGDDESAEGRFGAAELGDSRRRRIDPERQAVREPGVVDGDGAAGGELDAFGAERRVAGERAEEDVGAVLVHQLGGAVRMGAQPGADRLQRDLLLRQLAAVDEDPADRGVVVAVLRRVADAHDPAVGQADAARALDLEEEERHRVGDPEELEPASPERSVFDPY